MQYVYAVIETDYINGYNQSVLDMIWESREQALQSMIERVQSELPGHEIEVDDYYHSVCAFYLNSEHIARKYKVVSFLFFPAKY